MSSNPGIAKVRTCRLVVWIEEVVHVPLDAESQAQEKGKAHKYNDGKA